MANPVLSGNTTSTACPTISVLLVDACYRKNPQSGKGEYDFDNAVFSKEAFRDWKQWKLAFETDMEPSASEFLRLNEFAGCPASRNNADISKTVVSDGERIQSGI